MRYERTDETFLCIGVRGFDAATRPRIAPVRRR